MEDLQVQIEELKNRIRRDTLRLRKLKQTEYERQRAERSQYLSSREIAALIKEHTGKSCSMTTIKRWADRGYLGEVCEERKRFPALPARRGNKRFLYRKTTVFCYLREKGLLKPRFAVLDRVRLARPGPQRGEPEQTAVVMAAELADDSFVYTLQLEASGRIVRQIPEQQLAAAGDKR